MGFHSPAALHSKRTAGLHITACPPHSCTHDERDDQGNLHDRAGKFSRKENNAPSGSLGDDAGDPKTPLSIAILNRPDPVGGFDLAVEAPTGRYYLLDGHPHREDGPAYEGRDGTQERRLSGELHRDGAPAVIHDDGTEEFWEHGQPVQLP